MAEKYEAIKGRRALYNVDPRHLTIVDGFNPRCVDLDWESLMDSIKEHGVLQPIRVKKDKETGQTILIDGERRVRATLKLIEDGSLEAADGTDLTCLPAFLDTGISDTEALIMSLVVNDGKRLLPVEEGFAFKRLQETHKLSQKEIAQKIGRGSDYVFFRLKLLSLSVETQDKVNKGEISIMQAWHIEKGKRKGHDEKDLVDKSTKSDEGKKAVADLATKRKNKPGKAATQVDTQADEKTDQPATSKAKQLEEITKQNVKLTAALAVMILDPKISPWLHANDLMALEQAALALGLAWEEEKSLGDYNSKQFKAIQKQWYKTIHGTSQAEKRSE